MIWRILIHILIVISLVIIQVSFLSTWPFPIRNLDLLLSVIIFLTIIVSYHQALWWAFGAGLLMDFFSYGNFGIRSISMIITVMLINILFNNFFTNRSFYSVFLLSSFGTFVYNIILIISQFFLPALSVSSLTVLFQSYYVYYLLWQLVLNLLVVSIIFLIFNFSTGKLKANFIVGP